MTSAVQPYPERMAGLGLAEAKEELRRAIRAERDRMSPRARARAAEDFAQVVGDIPQVRAARCVAAYVARPNEPGTTPLLDRLAQRGTRVLLPVLGTGLARDWALLTTTTEFEVRAPGRPPEPSGPTLGVDALAEADAIIAPALAIDTDGGRLGQGGGWYDRVLAHARPGTVVIAMVFPEEIYDAALRPVPREPHDLAVDIVATPGGWRWLRTPDA
ncbi:MAG: 5-formyltetrahydrofolate cyclo-ligase [Cellulomonadaceae bacterium]|nr:5-formyltetrahydrofolate cyclo-ligase [Cellulomonadaceae bacterium]